MLKWLPLLLLSAVCLMGDKYSGPRPPQPDLPYLVHADTLVPTESLVAQQEDRKGEVAYVIAGAASTARTPLASPAFIIQTDQIQADHLQCFKLLSKTGRRECLLRRKNKLVARPIRLNVTRIDEGLYKVEVDELLENGEYALTPSDSNQVFCFQIY